MDQIIAETIKGISETITEPALINLDYADVATVLNQSGIGVMLVGETEDMNKSEEVVDDALNHPLLDVDYSSASSGMIHITGGPDLSLKDAETIAENITERLEAGANIIWGARIQENYQGKVRVMAIMAGIEDHLLFEANTQDRAEGSGETMRDSPTDSSVSVNEGVGVDSNGGDDGVDDTT